MGLGNSPAASLARSPVQAPNGPSPKALRHSSRSHWSLAVSAANSSEALVFTCVSLSISQDLLRSLLSRSRTTCCNCETSCSIAACASTSCATMPWNTVADSESSCANRRRASTWSATCCEALRNCPCTFVSSSQSATTSVRAEASFAMRFRDSTVHCSQRSCVVRMVARSSSMAVPRLRFCAKRTLLAPPCTISGSGSVPLASLLQYSPATMSRACRRICKHSSA
mmetsp:Transcript_71761/g.165958  ORF Transcript_71761/g.165958 Transcript_71761/m.165958 type:complete len:226 (-) Transcript_71761:163-840(-)